MAEFGQNTHADEFAPEVVARSKDVVATAAGALKDHERWLKDFVASEEESRKRHTSALKREQARYRRQLKRERTARAVRRAALSFVLSVRSMVRSLWRGLVGTIMSVRYATVAGAAWVASTTYALAISVLKACAAGLSWIGAKARIFCASMSKAASLAASFIAARAREAGTAALVAALAAIIWAVAAADEVARRSGYAVSIGASWLGSRAGTLAAHLRNAGLAGRRLDGRKDPRRCAILRACRLNRSCLDQDQGACRRRGSPRGGSDRFRLDCSKDEDTRRRIVRNRSSRPLVGAGGRASRHRARTREAASIGGAWSAAKMQALAHASSQYSSRGLSWTKTNGHGLAVRSRGAALAGSAWTAARTRTLARASSDAAASGVAWTRTKGQALVLPVPQCSFDWFELERRKGRYLHARIARRGIQRHLLDARDGWRVCADVARGGLDGVSLGPCNRRRGLCAALAVERRCKTDRRTPKRICRLPRHKAECASKGRDRCAEACGARRKTDAAMAQSRWRRLLPERWRKRS